MPAFNCGDDFIWVFGPDEGFGLLIALCEEAVDCGLKVNKGAERSALEAPLGEFCEEAFHGIEPGARGWGEVEDPARIRLIPPFRKKFRVLRWITAAANAF